MIGRYSTPLIRAKAELGFPRSWANMTNWGLRSCQIQRPQPTSPVIQPTFDPPHVSPRNRHGWLLLIIVVAFMVVAELVPYLSRSKDPKGDFARYETLLQASVTERESVRTLYRMAGLPEPPGTDTLDESLEDAISDLAALRHKDSEAARLYVAMRTEAHQRVVPADLAALKREPTPRNKAFAKIYGSEKLSPEEAAAAAKVLDKEQFLDRIAAVHAREKAGIKDARKALIDPASAAVLVSVVALGTGALILGALLWPIYFAARTSGRCKPLGHPVGTLSPPDADRYAMRAAQILLAMVFLSQVLGALVTGLPEWLENPAFSAAMLAAVVLLSRVPVWGVRIGLGSLGITRQNLGKNVLWGLGGALANVPIVLTLGFLGIEMFKFLPPPEHPASTALMANPSLPMILGTLFSASLMAPIIEETCFRGVLLPAISSAFRHVPSGVLLSSLIFAAIHPTGIPVWPALTAVGAMGAVLTYQTRSLVPTIVMHAVHNAGTLVIALLVASR